MIGLYFWLLIFSGMTHLYLTCKHVYQYIMIMNMIVDVVHMWSGLGSEVMASLYS